MKNKNVFLSLIVASIFALSFTSCKKDSPDAQQSPNNNAVGTSGAGTLRGNASVIPAYYDSTLFRIQFVEFPPSAEANLIAHNQSLNFIYQSDPGLPNNQPFISVIDAIPGDGMNPVWREVQITFNSGFTPRQLYSDDQVLNAAAGTNPEITLTMTDEVYWCPVFSH